MTALENETAAKRAETRSSESLPILDSITAKLSSTFVVMAALTAIACAIAWIVFGQIERSVSVITEESVPEITLALKIAEKSASIAAIAPAFVASETAAELSTQRAELDQAADDLKALIQERDRLGSTNELSSELSDAALVIELLIATIDAAKEAQIEIADELRSKIAALSALHGRFLETLEPLIDDTVFNLVIDSETSLAETTVSLNDEIEAGADQLQHLLEIKAEMHEVVGLLREANQNSPGSVDSPIQSAFAEAKTQIEIALSEIDSPVASSLTPSATAIFDIGQDIFLDGGPVPLDQAGTDDQGSRLSDANQRFQTAIEPQIDRARLTLIESAERITLQQGQTLTDVVDVGANSLVNLLMLRAEGNLAAGLLNEAANMIDDRALGPLVERFVAAAGQMERALSLLPENLDVTEVDGLVSELNSLGRGSGTIFDLKQRELTELDRARIALEESRTRAEAMSAAVGGLVEAAEATSSETLGRAQEIIRSSQIIMLLISAASLFGALFVMLAYVKPRLVRPIEEITVAMDRLADGDTSVEIPGRDRSDELGQMAKALAVFRDITIEVQESNLREIELARRRLSDAIESISEAFSLYDNEDKLVVCNEKYGSLVHPEIASQIKPGMTFEAILRLALDAGLLGEANGQEEEWLRRRIAQHRNPGSPHILERRNGVWIMISERKTADGGTVAVYSDITELKERENELAQKSMALEQLSSQLSKYLSPQVYQSIFTGEQSAVVASKRKKLTIFFSDLVGFTETADRLESEDLTQLINEYLTEMSAIALAHGATIDKYIGDAIMIFFGDPVSLGIKQDALLCARMAVAMQKRLHELSRSWSELGLVQDLECRMGIATGYCTVGNFGSEDRMDYTIIGGSVNLASRLESAAQPGSILISEETYNLIQDEIVCEPRETVKVKGIAYPVRTFQIVQEKGADVHTGRISERLGALSVDADLSAMSDKEREQAAALLRNILGQLGDGEKG